MYKLFTDLDKIYQLKLKVHLPLMLSKMIYLLSLQVKG